MRLDKALTYAMVTRSEAKKLLRGGSVTVNGKTEKDGGKETEVILAGPTCDSMDIMYENIKYRLPVDLKIGDKLYWLSTGAYTSTYASVEFNGFPPLKTYYME